MTSIVPLPNETAFAAPTTFKKTPCGCCQRIRLPHRVAFGWIVLVLVWGTCAPIKEYWIAAVALDSAQHRQLVVQPNYEGYTILTRFLQEVVNLTYNGTVQDQYGSEPINSRPSGAERLYLQHYMTGIIMSEVPVFYNANYTELLTTYGIAHRRIRAHADPANVQICQTFSDPTEDRFSSINPYELPTEWGNRVNRSDMGCSRDPIAMPNSPHTWLGGLFCIAGLDIFTSSEQTLTWAGFTPSHNIWSVNRAFWEAVYGALGPCVDPTSGTVLDAIRTLQRICKRFQLSPMHCRFPVQWLLSGDASLRWASDGFGVVNINFKKAFSAEVRSFFKYSRSFETRLVPLIPMESLLGDYPWQLFYTRECGVDLAGAMWGTNFTTHAYEVVEACYRRFYSIKYLSGYLLHRARDVNYLSGTIRYSITQDLTLDPVIRLPPRTLLTPTEVHRIVFPSVHRALTHTTLPKAHNMSDAHNLLLCVHSCASFCHQITFQNTSTIYLPIGIVIVTRRPGGSCMEQTVTNAIAQHAPQYCIDTTTRPSDPYAAWHQALVSFVHREGQWQRLSTSQVDLSCVFASITPPSDLTTITSDQQLLQLDSFLLRFAQIDRVSEIGMMTHSEVIYDPSLAVIQVLTVLFLIGTVVHGVQMFRLLRCWYIVRKLYHRTTNPLNFGTCRIDYAGIAYVQSRVRELTLCSSIKMLAAWFTTTYRFHVTTTGLMLLPVPESRSYIEILGGMTTSIWIAMAVNASRGRATTFLERSYMYFLFFTLSGGLYFFSDYGQYWNAIASRHLQIDEYTSACLITLMALLVVLYLADRWFERRRRYQTLVKIPAHWSCLAFLHGLSIFHIDARMTEPTRDEPDTNALLNVLLRHAPIEYLEHFEFFDRQVRQRNSSTLVIPPASDHHVMQSTRQLARGPTTVVPTCTQ